MMYTVQYLLPPGGGGVLQEKAKTYLFAKAYPP